MATRETIYRQFGPKIVEALAEVVKDEINVLRAQHGLPARTISQVGDAISAKLDVMPDYDWMGEVIPDE